MKKLIYIIAFAFLGASCSSDSGGDDPTSGEDSTPSVPVLVFPGKDQLCIDNTLDFKWNPSTNEDGSSIIYTVEIATDNQFNNVIVSEVQTELSKVVTLEKGLAFYWRVKARSSRGMDSGFSDTSQFYTEEVPETNNVPFSPDNTSPFVGENFSKNNITLEWTASDVDNDPLTYNVYFGKDKSALTLMQEDTQNSTFDVTVDAKQTIYYWQIVAKDDKGAETKSPIWNFKVNDF
jgi:hypothetical protein